MILRQCMSVPKHHTVFMPPQEMGKDAMLRPESGDVITSREARDVMSTIDVCNSVVKFFGYDAGRERMLV